MRILILLLFLLPIAALAQDKWALMHQADSFFQKKDYAMAVKLADDFFMQDSSCDGCAYNAAVYNAYAGNKQKAMDYLKKAFYYGYGAGRLDLETDFNNLHDEPEWPAIVKMGRDSYDGKLENLPKIQGRMLKKKYSDWQRDWEQSNKISINSVNTSPEQLYKTLTTLNGYKPFTAFGRYLYLYYKYNDTIDIPYLVVMPANYNPANSYPLLAVLHGAVNYNSLGYNADTFAVGSFHRHFTKYANQHNMIMVFPRGDGKINWMYPDDGFSVTENIIKYLKHYINVDDNSVYITGHSNGATGSFSYLMKSPSVFAAFSGMNTRPRVETGGTFLPNALYRSFYTIATDKDYYFPPNGNDTLNKLAHNLGIDWTLDIHKGYPHWYPQFDDADAPVGKMFDAMLAKKRNPYNKNIYWECDDVTHGVCDWLAITGLDTLAQPAAWHKQYNFNIHPWIYNENPDSLLDITKQAFKYPRKSGAVKASYSNNTFAIQASCVKGITLLLSPEMVDFRKPVTVLANGKKVFTGKIDYDTAFMLQNFEKNFDRQAVWVNKITLNL